MRTRGVVTTVDIRDNFIGANIVVVVVVVVAGVVVDVAWCCWC